MFYSCYKVGAWLLRTPPGKFHFALSSGWLMTELGRDPWVVFGLMKIQEKIKTEKLNQRPDLKTGLF